MNALFEKLRRLFGGAPEPAREDAEVRMHYPEPGHTSHWDLDYVSREEMEKLAEASRQARDKEHRD